MNNELKTKFDNEKEYQTDEYKRGYDRIQHLEDMLNKEKSDRIKSLDD